MVRKLFRWITVLLGILLLLLAGLAGYAWWQRDALLQALLEVVNEKLERPIKVGATHLSLSAFPSVSVQLRNVLAIDAQGDTLLNVEEVLASSSLHYWLKGNYTIDGLSIHNGSIHLTQSAAEQWNFEEWWKTDSLSNEGSAIALDRIEASHIRIRLETKTKALKMQSEWEKIVWKSPAAANSWNTSAELLGAQVQWQKQQVQLPKSDWYYVHQAQAQALEVTGSDWQVMLSQSTAEPIHLNARSSNLKAWVSNLHLPNKEQWEGVEGTWTFTGEVQADGNSGAITAKATDFSWKSQNQPQVAGEVELAYHWTPKISEIEASKLRLQVDNTQLQVSGRWDLLQDHAEIIAEGKGNLEDWADRIPETLGTDWKGSATINMQFEGPMDPSNWWQKAQWSLSVEDGGFRRSDQLRYTNGKGQLQWKNEILEVQNLLGELNGQEVFVNGRVVGLFKSEIPAVYLKLRSSELKLSSQNRQSRESIPIALPEVHAELLIETDELSIDKLEIHQLRAVVDLSPDGIEVHQLIGQTCNGSINGQGRIRPNASGYLMEAQIQVQALAINQLFQAFDNFGQDVMTSKQLSGSLSSTLDLQLPLNAQWEAQLGGLQLQAHSELEQAALRNFKPLALLAEEVQLDEIEVLKIDRHQQDWEIKEQCVVIKPARWKSNAIELQAEGLHYFNNQIDYRFNLPIEKVVGKKKTKMDDELGDYIIEVQERKQPRIYLRVTGSMNRPVVEVDRDGIRAGLQQEWKDQKPFEEEIEELSDRKKPVFQFEWEEEQDSLHPID